jgi:hypothetical protein
MHAVALDAAEREMANLTRVLSEQTARAAQGADLILLGTQSRLQEGEKDGSLMDPKAIHSLLRARIDGVPQVRQLSMLTAEGELAHTSSAFPAPPMSTGDRDYFRAHVDGPVDALYLGEPMLDPLDGKRSFQMSRRLASSDGDFRGVIAASVDLAYFQELYRSIRLPPGSVIVLFRTDGVPLVGELDVRERIDNAFVNLAIFGSAGAEPPPTESGRIVVAADGTPQIGAYRKSAGFRPALEWLTESFTHAPASSAA